MASGGYARRGDAGGAACAWTRQGKDRNGWHRGTRTGADRRHEASTGEAGEDWFAPRGKASAGQATKHRARFGMARFGMLARIGVVWHGKAGLARIGVASRLTARSVWVGQGWRGEDSKPMGGRGMANHGRAGEASFA